MSEYTELVERAEFAATSAKNSAAQTKSDKDTVVSLYNEIKAIIDAGGGGSCKFYECTSVGDTTWSGYEWLLTTRVIEPTPIPVTSFTISDSSIDGLDGTFTVDTDSGLYMGKSVYTNGAGKYCWWYTGRNQWCITTSIGNLGTVYAGAGVPNGATDFGEPWEGWTWYNDLNGDVVNSTIKVTPVTQEQEPVITEVYEKSNDITPGLSWTSVKPKVGKSYTEDALVEVTPYTGSIEIADMVFYAPLAEDLTAAGAVLSSDFTATFSKVDGIPCVYIPQGSRLTSDGVIEANASEFSIAWWSKLDTQRPEAWTFIMGNNPTSNGCVLYRYYDNTKVGADTSGSPWEIQTVDHTAWNFFSVVCKNGTFSCYVNGQLAKTHVANGFSLSSGWFSLGHTDNAFAGYMAAVRMFNRAITADEVATLYEEHLS